MDIEKIVVELTRAIHPEDLGKETSELENKIRQALQSYQKGLVEKIEGLRKIKETDNEPYLTQNGTLTNRYASDDVKKGFNSALDTVKESIDDKGNWAGEVVGGGGGGGYGLCANCGGLAGDSPNNPPGARKCRYGAYDCMD